MISLYPTTAAHNGLLVMAFLEGDFTKNHSYQTFLKEVPHFGEISSTRT